MVIVTTSLHSCSNVYLPVFLHASTSEFSIAQVDTVQQGLEIIPDLSWGNLLNDCTVLCYWKMGWASHIQLLRLYNQPQGNYMLTTTFEV